MKKIFLLMILTITMCANPTRDNVNDPSSSLISNIIDDTNGTIDNSDDTAQNNSNDIVSPIVNLKGADTIWHQQGIPYTDPGVLVSDNESSVEYLINHTHINLENVDISTSGVYEVYINVTDEAGNETTVTRIVIVTADEIPNQPPVLTLSVDKDTFYILIGNEFTPPECSAYDQEDGDLTNQITTSHNIDNTMEGIYFFEYGVMDSKEEYVTKKITVIVRSNLNNNSKYKIKITSDRIFDNDSTKLVFIDGEIIKIQNIQAWINGKEAVIEDISNYDGLPISYGSEYHLSWKITDLAGKAPDSIFTMNIEILSKTFDVNYSTTPGFDKDSLTITLIDGAQVGLPDVNGVRLDNTDSILGDFQDSSAIKNGETPPIGIYHAYWLLRDTPYTGLNIDSLINITVIVKGKATVTPAIIQKFTFSDDPSTGLLTDLITSEKVSYGSSSKLVFDHFGDAKKAHLLDIPDIKIPWKLSDENAYSISLWFQIKNKNYQKILSSTDNSGFFLASEYNNEDNFRLSYDNNTSYVYSSSIDTNRWQHIVITYKNGTITMYRNGSKLNYQLTGISSFDVSSINLGDGLVSNGIIFDDYSVYNYALDSDKVLELYNNKNWPDKYFTDVRDGSTYKTTNVEGQVWLAQNLRYLPKGNPADGSDRIIKGDETGDYNIENNGLYYDWAGAMNVDKSYNNKLLNISNTENYQGICPDGWRLPTVSDIEELKNAGVYQPTLRTSSFGNGTNIYGINFIGSGRYNPDTKTFEYFGDRNYHHLANEKDATYSYNHYVSKDGQTLSSGTGYYKTYFYSVRCIKQN